MADVTSSDTRNRLQSSAGLPFRLWLPNFKEQEGEGVDVSLRCAGVETWDQGDTNGLETCTPVAASLRLKVCEEHIAIHQTAQYSYHTTKALPMRKYTTHENSTA